MSPGELMRIHGLWYSQLISSLKPLRAFSLMLRMHCSIYTLR